MSDQQSGGQPAGQAQDGNGGAPPASSGGLGGAGQPAVVAGQPITGNGQAQNGNGTAHPLMQGGPVGGPQTLAAALDRIRAINENIQDLYTEIDQQAQIEQNLRERLDQAEANHEQQTQALQSRIRDLAREVVRLEEVNAEQRAELDIILAEMDINDQEDDIERQAQEALHVDDVQAGMDEIRDLRGQVTQHRTELVQEREQHHNQLNQSNVRVLTLARILRQVTADRDLLRNLVATNSATAAADLTVVEQTLDVALHDLNAARESLEQETRNRIERDEELAQAQLNAETLLEQERRRCENRRRETAVQHQAQNDRLREEYNRLLVENVALRAQGFPNVGVAPRGGRGRGARRGRRARGGRGGGRRGGRRGGVVRAGSIPAAPVPAAPVPAGTQTDQPSSSNRRSKRLAGEAPEYGFDGKRRKLDE